MVSAVRDARRPSWLSAETKRAECCQSPKFALVDLIHGVLGFGYCGWDRVRTKVSDSTDRYFATTLLTRRKIGNRTCPRLRPAKLASLWSEGDLVEEALRPCGSRTRLSNVVGERISWEYK